MPQEQHLSRNDQIVVYFPVKNGKGIKREYRCSGWKKIRRPLLRCGQKLSQKACLEHRKLDVDVYPATFIERANRKLYTAPV